MTDKIETGKASIRREMAAMEAKNVETLKTYTHDELMSASREAGELMDTLNGEEMTEAERAHALKMFSHPGIAYSNNIHALKNYKATLEADLMEVTTKYVWLPRGQKLVSPSGFHPDERVYLSVKGAVQSDVKQTRPGMDGFQVSTPAK